MIRLNLMTLGSTGIISGRTYQQNYQLTFKVEVKVIHVKQRLSAHHDTLRYITCVNLASLNRFFIGYYAVNYHYCADTLGVCLSAKLAK